MEGDVEGQMGDPYRATVSSFITDMPTLPLCLRESHQALFPASGSSTCLTGSSLSVSPPLLKKPLCSSPTGPASGTQ